MIPRCGGLEEMILPDGIFLSLKHGCLGTKVNSSVRDNRGGNDINRIFKTNKNIVERKGLFLCLFKVYLLRKVRCGGNVFVLLRVILFMLPAKHLYKTSHVLCKM